MKIILYLEDRLLICLKLKLVLVVVSRFQIAYSLFSYIVIALSMFSR